MAITNADAIRFANEHIRTTADRLSRAFYACQKLKNDWNALSGTDDERFALLKNNIATLGGKMQDWYGQVFSSKRLYDSLGMGTFYPNDVNEVLVDGAPQDGRSPITGQDIRRINARMKEFLAWLERAEFNDASLNPINYTNLEQFMRAASGTSLITTAWGKQVANTRAPELVTQWTVTNPTYLDHIVKVAVNGIQV